MDERGAAPHPDALDDAGEALAALAVDVAEGAFSEPGCGTAEKALDLPGKPRGSLDRDCRLFTIPLIGRSGKAA